MTSKEIIQKAKDRFKELEHKNFDWRSFYNGYLEAVAEDYHKEKQRELLIEYEKHHYTSNEWISVSEQCVEAIDNFLKTKTNENFNLS